MLIANNVNNKLNNVEVIKTVIEALLHMYDKRKKQDLEAYM